ncbi:MAG: S9 family peptidase [Cyclobacteriaceae bacterium]
MKVFQLKFCIVIYFISSSLTTLAQRNELTLPDIYKHNIYKSKGYGPVKWLKDGSGYTSVENSQTGYGQDIVQYDPESGDRKILVSAKDLIPKGSNKPLRVSDYMWSDNNSKLLIFTNTRRVWRYHTRGDYWVLNMQSKELQQVGISLKSTTLQFAKFSPDGKKVGYVSEKNIYIEDLKSKHITQITADRGGNIINGTFDWVYEEELSLRDGFRWSPDSEKIAYWQMDTEGIGTFYMINNLDSIYPKLIPIPYPKVGTTNPSSRIGVVNLKNNETTWMKVPGDPRYHYLARMDWAYSSEELIIQQLNRKQNTNKVFFAKAPDGSVNNIFTEKVETWLDVYDDLVWLDDGKEFTWNSDRTGWKHAYKVSRDGQKLTPITQGDFEVINLLKTDKKGGYIYYIASPDSPTQRFLYRSKLNGKGKPERLTPANQPGHHRYQISEDSKYAIHTYSNHSTPSQIDLISLPDHKTIRLLEGNEDLRKKLAEVNRQEKEFFRVTIDDGTELDGWMIKPKDFDSSNKYPVLFFVYGEPAGSTVQDSWSRNMLWHQFLANQGYLVMSIDNRGTKVPRGRAWRKSIYKQIGILAAKDQAAAARKIMEWDFVDSDRIGIWGWSGGGSMSLNCLFRFPEIYKTGIAIAFISDQMLYDTIYQERFMSLPEDNEYGYREGSPITHAKNLEGNLLLIHGSGDDNCHYQSCERLVDELIKQNKYFTMVEYPMRSHSIKERDNTTLHLRKTMFEYLKRNLTPGAI